MRNKVYFITNKERNNFVYCNRLNKDVQINKTCHQGLGNKKEDTCLFFNGGGRDKQGNNYIGCNFGEGDSGIQLELKGGE